MTDLSGRVAVVTGASYGVGKGVASGQALVAAALAREYGFKDVDGKQPRPLTLEDV
jgi:NAD(P)-dependent dehydrogenase (short-subunit alcohol dehydrogenase family)